MNNFDYKNMTPFKWFVLENFPFIENDFEAINNYRLFSKIVEYLNKVIDDMNQVGQQTENITNAMTNLQNYVNNYFDNLNIQEEINNKLDKMVLDGTLMNLIEPYIDTVFTPALNNMQSQIDGLASGSPLVATSTSEMVDTSRVYVNTSDGHWYYYNGSTWVDGGVYQSTGIAKGSIGLYELNENIATQFEKEEILNLSITQGTHYRISNGKVIANTSSQNYNSTVLDVVYGEIYNITATEHSPNTYGYIFTDDEDNVISYGMQGTNVDATFNEIVKVPTGATKLYSSFYFLGAHDIKKITIKNSIGELENKFNFTSNIYNKLNLDIKDGSHYRISNGTVIENTQFASYSSTVLDVSENEIYFIEATENSANTYGYIFTDDDDNVISYGMRGTGTTTNLQEKIYVPTNATKLYSSFNNSGELNIYKNSSIYENFANKNISVIGDSISTKVNKNAVEIEITEQDIGVELQAYVTYYDIQDGLTLGGTTYNNSHIGTLITFTPNANDVGKTVGKVLNYNGNSTTTYWELLEQKLNCKVNNVSWSGASITSHQGNEEVLKTSYAWHDAQINKVGKRKAGTMSRTAPDTIIIYRGTNDFSHLPYATIDTSVLDNILTIPDTDVVNNNYDYVLGLAILIKKLRAKYPSSEIYLCTLNVFKRVNYSEFPTNNGINSLPAYNNAIRKVADYFGCKLIEFDKDGITFENCYTDGYITDSQTTPTHPNSKGHKKMYEQLIKDVSNYIPI